MLWGVRVLLGGSDVTSTVTGIIDVEAEESTARIAEFSLLPSGVIDVNDWIGKTASIDFLTYNAAGATLTDNRIFTGNVALPVYSVQSGMVTFRCTDSLQERFEGMTSAAILSELTGYYHSSSFGERVDGWQYAEDVLSTVPKGFDLNADGVTGALTAWEAKATPDYSLSSSDIIDGSLSVDLANRRDIVNKITIDFDYRFSRSVHREHDYAWVIPSWDFCTYYADTHNLPNREMVTQAAEGTGWAIQGPISYGELPDSGSPMCGGNPVVWIIHPDLQDQLVTSAGWTGIKRWSQTVTETYTMTVQAPQSITHFGEIALTEEGSYTTEYDDSSWESSEDTATPVSATQNAINDWVIDRADRTESNNAIQTKLNLKSTSILKAHRENFVSWEMPLLANVERSHTFYVNAATADNRSIESKGKCYKFTHELDIDSGSAVTGIIIAVSKTGTATPPTPDSLIQPSAPSTVPAISAPASTTALQTQLGGKTGTPVHDTNKDGFSGNYTAQDYAAEIYPFQFRADSYDIEDEARNEITGTTVQNYNIVIPDETLVITA